MSECMALRELVAADAIGALEPVEHELVRAHLAACAACTAERERFAALPPLLDLVGPTSSAVRRPRPAVLEAILDGHTIGARPNRRRTRSPRAVAAAMALALAVGGILTVSSRGPNAPGQPKLLDQYTLRGAPGALGDAVLAAGPSGTAVRLSVRGLADDARGYELWFERGDIRARVGAFRVGPSGTRTVRLSTDRDLTGFDRMSIVRVSSSRAVLIADL